MMYVAQVVHARDEHRKGQDLIKPAMENICKVVHTVEPETWKTTCNLVPHCGCYSCTQ